MPCENGGRVQSTVMSWISRSLQSVSRSGCVAPAKESSAPLPNISRPSYPRKSIRTASDAAKLYLPAGKTRRALRFPSVAMAFWTAAVASFWPVGSAPKSTTEARLALPSGISTSGHAGRPAASTAPPATAGSHHVAKELATLHHRRLLLEGCTRAFGGRPKAWCRHHSSQAAALQFNFRCGPASRPPSPSRHLNHSPRSFILYGDSRHPDASGHDHQAQQ